MQGDGELAGAEVGAEVAADLADRVDDVGRASPARPAVAGRRRAPADRPASRCRRAGSASPRCAARLLGARSFVPGENVVGDPLQVIGGARGLG